jgi:hypothetical protein
MTIQFVTGAHINDFVSYWAAARQLLHHGNPYGAAEILNLERAAGFPPDFRVVLMRNPPLSLPIVYPFGLFAVATAARLWLVFLIACAALSIWLLRGSYKQLDARTAWLGLGFSPLLAGLHAEQFAPVLLLGVALFVRLEKKRPFAAGVGLGLCLVKPHLFVPLAATLFVWSLTRRRYAILSGVAVFVLLMGGISYAIAPAAWTQYREMMAASSVHTEMIPCLSVLLRRWVSPSSTWLQYLPCMAGTLWALYYFYRNRSTWVWRSSLPILLIVSLMVAPYMWYTDEAVLLCAILFGIGCVSSRLPLMSAIVLNAIFLIAQIGFYSFHSYWVALTAPAWLGWYVMVKRQCGLPMVQGEEPPADDVRPREACEAGAAALHSSS